MPMQLGLLKHMKNSGAGSFKAPMKLERLNVSESSLFFFLLVTEPLVISLASSNTHGESDRSSL